MPPHRKDNLGHLIQFARNSSRFYREHLKSISANAVSVDELPITKPNEYWQSLNEVTTAPITPQTIMRSGSPTDDTKKVYLTKDEISTATSTCASALVSQGTGLLPGDRVANIPHQGSPHGSFTIMNTAILNLPISVVHLPIAEDDSVENKVHFLEIYEATVLLATFSTARNIAQNLRERGKTLPKLRLVLYSGACFSADQTPVPQSAFPNAIVCPSEFGSMSAGLLGIPAQPFRREDGPNPVYKVLEPLVVVEIVMDNGQPITASGVRGNMVVTHLVRRLQPMIRFPIGVTASWVNYGLETFRVHED